jgi:dTDP-4-amino-4,6-dideoxygalactose transaminase
MPVESAALLDDAVVDAAARPKRPKLFPERFRFIQPTLPELEHVIARYWQAHRSGMITNAGLVARLESAVAERLAVKHCVAVSSCTSGLMLTMKALGLAGEVVMPSFTFFATGHAALWNGLTPVFADCLAGRWTVDPASVERQIGERTSAIVGVHLYGNPCRAAELAELARRHNLKLIFDAAHAFGSRYRGTPVGGLGDAEVFSLSPTKLLVAGEGGFVTTNDATLARLVRAGRNYGDLGAYDPETLGLNARMSEFHAALALAGLVLLDRKVARHNRIASAYTRLLAEVDGLGFQEVEAEDLSTYKDYSVLIDPSRFPATRDETAAMLLEDNIETKKYFHPPLHQQRLYRKYYRPEIEPLSVTERIAGGVLSLPVYESLPETSVQKIAQAIRRIQAARGREAA